MAFRLAEGFLPWIWLGRYREGEDALRLLFVATGEAIGPYDVLPWLEWLPQRCAGCGRQVAVGGFSPVTPYLVGEGLSWACHGCLAGERVSIPPGQLDAGRRTFDAYAERVRALFHLDKIPPVYGVKEGA